jgi:hypothetical protein
LFVSLDYINRTIYSRFRTGLCSLLRQGSWIDSWILNALFVVAILVSIAAVCKIFTSYQKIAFQEGCAVDESQLLKLIVTLVLKS